MCPSCMQRRSLDFAEFVNEEVLEQVPYRHVVTTVPKVLRRYFLRDRALLRELGHCVWKTLCRGLRTALEDPRVVPGAILVRASAGDLCNGHPHIHSMFSCGAWTEGGRGHFLPWPDHLTSEDLEQLFRRKVLALLVRRNRITQATADRLMQWAPTGFSVWIGNPIEPHETASRLRLARYLVKPPVCLERMDFDAENCLVTYRSDSQGRTRRVQALDFLADLSVHIPDPGEHGVSYLGRCSNRSRGSRRKQEAPSEPSPGPLPQTPSRKAFRTAWAQLLKKVWAVDITRCPRCGGSVRIRSAVLLYSAIKKILEHLGIPWPRPPNQHDCPPLPGAQMPLPLVSPARPPDVVPPEDERDPRLVEDWPIDAPFEDDLAS